MLFFVVTLICSPRQLNLPQTRSKLASHCVPWPPIRLCTCAVKDVPSRDVTSLKSLLGTPSGICLFSFHFASATIGRITVSRHIRQQLPLCQLESLVHKLACAPTSAGICYPCTLNGVCPFCFHFASATVDRICYLGMLNGICLLRLNFAHCIGHHRPDHCI